MLTGTRLFADVLQHYTCSKYELIKSTVCSPLDLIVIIGSCGIGAIKHFGTC